MYFFFLPGMAPRGPTGGHAGQPRPGEVRAGSRREGGTPAGPRPPLISTPRGGLVAAPGYRGEGVAAPGAAHGAGRGAGRHGGAGGEIRQRRVRECGGAGPGVSLHNGCLGGPPHFTLVMVCLFTFPHIFIWSVSSPSPSSCVCLHFHLFRVLLFQHLHHNTALLAPSVGLLGRPCLSFYCG